MSSPRRDIPVVPHNPFICGVTASQLGGVTAKGKRPCMFHRTKRCRRPPTHHITTASVPRPPTSRFEFCRGASTYRRPNRLPRCQFDCRQNDDVLCSLASVALVKGSALGVQSCTDLCCHGRWSVNGASTAASFAGSSLSHACTPSRAHQEPQVCIARSGKRPRNAGRS